MADAVASSPPATASVASKASTVSQVLAESQIEAVMLTHPAVKEVVVIGVPDPYRGERPRAFVTLQAPGQTPAQADGAVLAAWLNERLGKHERVDSVVVRESLPKTMVGKLDRKALRAEVAAT